MLFVQWFRLGLHMPCQNLQTGKLCVRLAVRYAGNDRHDENRYFFKMVVFAHARDHNLTNSHVMLDVATGKPFFHVT